MSARKFLAGVGLVASLALAACGGGGGEGGEGNGAAGGSTLNVGADPAGALVFQPNALSATAGQPITVNFNNPAPLQHNWVLVQPGQEDAVAGAADPTGAVPDGTPGVIAKAGVQNQNGQETVNVPAKAAGSYSYICTVPGHYPGGMRGTLTVQ